MVLKIYRTFPFDSCCVKPAAFNPASVQEKLADIEEPLTLYENKIYTVGFPMAPELAVFI